MIKQYICKKRLHTKKNKISYTILKTIKDDCYIYHYAACDYCQSNYAVMVESSNSDKVAVYIRNRKLERKAKIPIALQKLNDEEWFMALVQEFIETRQRILHKILTEGPLIFRGP